MKNNILLNMLVFLILSFGCASVKPNSDFTAKNVSVQKENKKTVVSLQIATKNNILFEDMFYNNSKAKIKRNGNVLKAIFVNTQPNDIILHGDATKEFGNSITNLPVNTNNGELFLSYKKENTIHYQQIKY